MKDFDSWNNLKKNINNRNMSPKFNNGDIWWINLGVNIGYEVDGKNELFERPVLVLRKHNQETFLGVTLTGKEKKNKWHIKIVQGEKEFMINTSQIRTISSKRLIRRMVRLNDDNLLKVMSLIIKNQLSIKDETTLAGGFSGANGGLTNTVYKIEK